MLLDGKAGTLDQTAAGPHLRQLPRIWPATEQRTTVGVGDGGSGWSHPHGGPWENVEH